MKADPLAIEGAGQPHQGDALMGQRAKIDGLAATGATDRDGHVLAARLGDLGVPLPQDPEPPAEIAIAIGARRPVMGAHRQVDLATCALQLISDLHPRRARPHHQHRACGQLLRVAIIGGVDLLQGAVPGGDRRDHRPLEGAGGRHHPIGLDHPRRRLDGKARAPAVAQHLAHFNAGADRRVDFLRIGFEVVRHLVLGGKAVGVDGKLQPREAVVPGRPVGHQRIPAASAPGLGHPAAFQYQVRHPEGAQVFAHGHAGLARANHQGIHVYLFYGHVCVLLRDGERQCNGWSPCSEPGCGSDAADGATDAEEGKILKMCSLAKKKRGSPGPAGQAGPHSAAPEAGLPGAIADYPRAWARAAVNCTWV